MLISWYNIVAIYKKSNIVKQIGLESNYLVVYIVYFKLLKCPIEDNKALMTASYLLSVSSVISGFLDFNMAINAAKTKTMTNPEDVLDIEVGAKRLEQVNSFVYLGCSLTKDVDCANEVKSRQLWSNWSKYGRTKS